MTIARPLAAALLFFACAVPISLAAIVLAAVPAMAQAGACRVADPTGTPLNLRSSPFGIVTGTVENGRRVTIIDYARDAKGNPWVYIGDARANAPLGWVYQRFLACE